MAAIARVGIPEAIQVVYSADTAEGLAIIDKCSKAGTHILGIASTLEAATELSKRYPQAIFVDSSQEYSTEVLQEIASKTFCLDVRRPPELAVSNPDSDLERSLFTPSPFHTMHKEVEIDDDLQVFLEEIGLKEWIGADDEALPCHFTFENDAGRKVLFKAAFQLPDYHMRMSMGSASEKRVIKDIQLIKEKLALQGDEYLDIGTNKGTTAVHGSVTRGNLDLLTQLMEAGADITKPQTTLGASTLHCAVWRGTQACSHALTCHAPELLTKVNAIGQTALEYAIAILDKIKDQSFDPTINYCNFMHAPPKNASEYAEQLEIYSALVEDLMTLHVLKLAGLSLEGENPVEALFTLIRSCELNTLVLIRQYAPGLLTKTNADELTALDFCKACLEDLGGSFADMPSSLPHLLEAPANEEKYKHLKLQYSSQIPSLLTISG